MPAPVVSKSTPFARGGPRSSPSTFLGEGCGALAFSAHAPEANESALETHGIQAFGLPLKIILIDGTVVGDVVDFQVTDQPIQGDWCALGGTVL